MAQNYSYPSSSQVTISGIGDPTGLGVPTNAVYIAGEDPSGDLQGAKVNAQRELLVSVDDLPLPAGAATAAKQDAQTALLTSLNARVAGSLVPLAFNEVDLTYVTVGNGIGQVETAIYKLAAATIATLTFTYDGSDRLSSVVKS